MKKYLDLYRRAENAQESYRRNIYKVNEQIEKKFGYGEMWIDHNVSDGMVFVYHDDKNAIASSEVLEKVLNCNTIEEAIEIIEPYGI